MAVGVVDALAAMFSGGEAESLVRVVGSSPSRVRGGDDRGAVANPVPRLVDEVVPLQMLVAAAAAVGAISSRQVAG